MKQANKIRKVQKEIQHTKSMHITLLRHFPTEYNHQKKLQGRRDISIDMELAQQKLADINTALLLPRGSEDATWLSSPLLRAQQTATLLYKKLYHRDVDINTIQTENFLIEMDFGDYEGQTIKELRMGHGDDFTKNEERGIHFTPPNGESPFMVQERLKKGLLDLFNQQTAASLSQNAVPHYICITHKGVMRAMLSLATGWDMKNDYPQKLDYQKAWEFDVSLDGEKLRVNYCRKNDCKHSTIWL